MALIMIDLYKTNQDFRDYVDRYSKKHDISKYEAMSHKLVQGVAEYYRELEKESNNRL